MTTGQKKPELNPMRIDHATANQVQSGQAHTFAAEQSEVGQYLLQRQQQLQVVATTTTRSGQVLDWIDPLTQVSDGKIASPPPVKSTPNAAPDLERPVQLVTFELEEQEQARGPAGTVPVLRRNIDALGYGKSLQDFLSKDGRGSRLIPFDQREAYKKADAFIGHWYANSWQTGTFYGGQGNISAWTPYVEWSNEFSLGQIGLSNSGPQGLQTVEAGWQVYKDLYGDWNAHLFVFYTTNGYSSQGDYLGGYNQDVKGWVQYSNTIYPGILSSPTSTLGGSQYIMSIKYQLYQGNWWLMCNNQWVGYYPASLYGGTGLSTSANVLGFWGEVINSGRDAPQMTQTDMGSGHWPYEGWTYSAYMSNLYYLSDTVGSLTSYQGSVAETNRLCYDIQGQFDNTGSWQSYFWWGGSGRNSECP